VKQFRTYVVIAGMIVAVYAVIALWLDREAAQQYESEFNKQQALQTQLSAKSIEDHFAWIQREMLIATTYLIPHLLKGEVPDSATEVMTGAADYELYPAEELALCFFVRPDTSHSFYRAPGEAGQLGHDLLEEWLETHWDAVQNSSELFVTPFYATAEYQLYGVLLPVVTSDDRFVGVLGITLDFAPILENFVIPIRLGQFGAAWVQAADSYVIFDHEPETIGQYVTEIAQSYPDLQRLNRRLMTEDEGRGEYHYTAELKGKVVRKLVAWSTAYLGNQRLTIALSAPDTEINANLAFSREQTVLLGILLGVTLVACGGLFYYSQQRTLQKEVAARTQELEQLTADLEQRVTFRTAELEQERAQLRTILEAMDDGLLYRQDQQIVYANSALTRLLGYTYDELRSGSSKVFQEIASAVDPTLLASRQTGLQHMVGQRAVWRQEAKLKRKDGSLFDASIYVAPVHNRQNQPIGMVEIIRDISREKNLQAQRDRFITNAAHELRRPLTNLKTRLYLLGRQPDKLHEHVEIIQKATDDMAELVQDLVDMAQLAGRKLQLNRRDIVLQHVLQSALDIQQGHAYRVRVKLNTDIPESPICTSADYERLTQTFNSLIAHAIQSTAPDGSVLVRLYEQPGRVFVEIDDDGPIIDPAQLTYVFEPFFQPSEGNIQRTGMGLALARQIIEQHGGQITVKSSAGSNRFIVQMPLMVKQRQTAS
jgi:PAS domain S-box-containing protein